MIIILLGWKLYCFHQLLSLALLPWLWQHRWNCQMPWKQRPWALGAIKKCRTKLNFKSLQQTQALDLLCTFSKVFKSDSHWTRAYLYPEIFRMYQQQLLVPSFFLLLALSSTPVHADIRGGQKQALCFLSRTHLIPWEHRGWLPTLTSCSWPQPDTISLSRAAQLSAKPTPLCWAYLVGRGLKRCPFTVQPVQQAVRVGAIAVHRPPGGPSPFQPRLLFLCTFPEELHLTFPQLGKQGVTLPVVAVPYLNCSTLRHLPI